ncbi:hypothetical protein BGZ82_000561 [Podila clonocystis]|nr:hypothetical protein BGZ82_000561 [Podila clonocystis]
MKIASIAIASLLILGSVKADAIVDDALAAHNEERKKYGVPDLAWDAELAKTAQDNIKGCDFDTLTEIGAGANYGVNPDFTSVRKAVNEWMKEAKKYKYDDPKSAGDSTAFTQIVWKASEKVGCAVTKCDEPDNLNYGVVCRYSPPGNADGEYKANVLKPASKK